MPWTTAGTAEQSLLLQSPLLHGSNQPAKTGSREVADDDAGPHATPSRIASFQPTRPATVGNRGCSPPHTRHSTARNQIKNCNPCPWRRNFLFSRSFLRILTLGPESPAFLNALPDCRERSPLYSSKHTVFWRGSDGYRWERSHRRFDPGVIYPPDE